MAIRHEPTTDRKGFTLVELATVMMVVGLVTAGFLKGQQIMAQSRVRATVVQIQGFQSAMNNFKDAYGQLPGDLGKAPQILEGCTVENGCQQGDGNGKVGLSIVDILSDDQSRLGEEPSQFWRHLAIAGFTTGIDTTSQIKSWGHSHPAAPFNGGFQIVFFDRKSAYGPEYINSHLIVMRKSIQGPFLMGEKHEVIAPIYAEMIDRKLDDGLAHRGFVKSVGVGCDEYFGGADIRTGIYKKTSDENCAMIFQVDRSS